MHMPDTLRGLRHRLRIISPAAVLTLLLVLASTAPVAAAGSGVLYVAPASASYGVGSVVAVAVRENSNSEPVNAVQTDLSYDAATLEYVAVDGTQSAFSIDASHSGGGGKISIARGSITALTGDKLVAVVTFRVLAVGTATIQMLGSSQLLATSDSNDIAGSRQGASYSVTAANGQTSVPPSGSGTSSGGSSGKATSSSPNVTVKSQTKAPSGSTSTASTSNTATSNVELSGALTIEATPNTSKPITKVEYYLNKKLIATISKAPYKYTVDSTDMRNGTYTLTTKTHYKDGTVDATDTSLVVKNPWNAHQLWLQVRHYAWLAVIVLLIIADIIWVALRRRKRNRAAMPVGQPQPLTVFGGDEGGSFARQNPPAVRPSVTAPSSAPQPPVTPPAGAVSPAPITPPADAPAPTPATPEAAPDSSRNLPPQA